MEENDFELATAAGGGDDRAFHRLVDRHADDLFRIAMSMSRNRADAEDLVQETLVGAYRGIRNFAGRSSVRTWLVKILSRQAAKAWHRSRHNRKTASIHRAEDGGERADAGLSSTVGLRSAEQRMDIMQTLESLTPTHREVLVLREIQGLSYEEIAEVLGVPRGTVESRLSRARAEFRERLGA